MRWKQTVKCGADAIYIDSQSEVGGWRFGTGWAGASGGSFSEISFSRQSNLHGGKRAQLSGQLLSEKSCALAAKATVVGSPQKN